jgi:hypothetical protein
MKLCTLLFVLSAALLGACDRPQQAGNANEGKAAQSAAGGGSNEGKAIGQAR